MQLEESIIEQLPQIPYVIDQVGEAFKWAKEELGEGEYRRAIEIAYETAEFTRKISDPNFFKTHYVVASVLSNIEGVKGKENFKKFDSASKSVEKTLDAITVDPELIKNKGCFKAIMLHLIPLAKENMELFTVELIGIKHDLAEILKGMKAADVKSPITGNDYIVILGYALVFANIRMANIKMTNEAYQIYNDILVMLNNDLIY